MNLRPSTTSAGNPALQEEIARKYILENFEPTDQIAVVLLNKRAGAVVQRIASAEKVASPGFQAWLRHMNAGKYEVYVSMNTLKQGARRRRKQDVEQIRHIFLDFDGNGTASVEALLRRVDIPEPNYLLNSSPGKWQVIWKIRECSKQRAEQIERALVQDTGADPAVIDVARVLRLPGFYNHKYGQPHLILLERGSLQISSPEQFPQVAGNRRMSEARTHTRPRWGAITQSERDWAQVCEALRRGADPEALIAELEARRPEKNNPADYSRRTVEKAAASLNRDSSPER